MGRCRACQLKEHNLKFSVEQFSHNSLSNNAKLKRDTSRVIPSPDPSGHVFFVWLGEREVRFFISLRESKSKHAISLEKDFWIGGRGGARVEGLF